jgi:hypothetical protein
VAVAGHDIRTLEGGILSALMATESGRTVAVRTEALSAGLGSCSREPTLAEFVIVPGEAAIRLRVSRALAPAAMLPKSARKV